MKASTLDVTEGTAMSAPKGRLSARRLKTLAILVAVSGLTGAHFLVAHGTHGLHEIHILLGVFSSLIEERPYKPAMEVKRAMEIIQELAGTKLDLEGVRVLQQLVDEDAPVL